MDIDRRTLLKVGGTTLVSGLLAGCSAPDAESTAKDVSAEAAVAAEWNVLRARLHDAFALGVAGEFDAGTTVAEDTFARFEQATGEWGAHEKLEGTSETHYEEFEEAVGQLKTRLREENTEEMSVELGLGNEHLREAQVQLVGERNVRALDLQLLGTRLENAAMVAAAGNLSGARTIATRALSAFEDGDLRDALESANEETYGAFEHAAKTMVRAAKNGKADVVANQSNDAVTAAVSGSYGLGTENVGGAGHIAVMQAQAFDANALASLGGPSASFAHAATLNGYRIRAADCTRLVARGETKRAAKVAEDIFADFEASDAHEALEEGDEDAYEGFESGLEALTTASESGDGTAVEEAVSKVDTNLRAGIETLGTGVQPAILQAGFFRARFADALERHKRGESDAAATVAQSLFARFEKNELDMHETLEGTSEQLYDRFEHEHLKEGLIPALKGNGSGASAHFEGAMQALLDFETKAASASVVAGAEASFMAGRAFDAAVVAKLGDAKRANAIVEATFAHFESGAGGYHEALEHADTDRYESFEAALGNVGGADDTYAKAVEFGHEAVESVSAVVTNTGGDFGGAAATIVQDSFSQFERSEVHESLESGDKNAYESFEAKLTAYADALDSGEDVDSANDAFATAALRAEFAVVGELDKAPVGEAKKESGEESKTKLKGGPNVQKGVPDAADHVIDVKAVSFDPEKLRIETGDTVAWKHVGGEAHTVTAREESLPEGASYWASGGFDSEKKAVSGWDAGKGAVQSGQSYVHTFETKGTFEYYCIPHEAAGMTGTIVVE
ncbi:DUF5059 domain-containing protein [Haladaptatus paucihalophilus]|uniref:Plastocyanin n=1 Tax=Haladaptatus paucihalophilus DX253 TaxID=797209 RepID=A0A1M6QLE0_HALPU|nr:DUF5059 domain-containing protein [Haladaptatus paucihalophilus]SHK21061.1 Plastocyanin [Haladaptatus paucihalophilus DX253]